MIKISYYLAYQIFMYQGETSVPLHTVALFSLKSRDKINHNVLRECMNKQKVAHILKGILLSHKHNYKYFKLWTQKWNWETVLSKISQTQNNKQMILLIHL